MPGLEAALEEEGLLFVYMLYLYSNGRYIQYG